MTREEAIGIIRKYECCSEHYEACEMAIKALEEPEWETGHWTNIQIDKHGYGSADCSLCGCTVHNNFSAVVNYCPNCGAEMERFKVGANDNNI